MFMHGEREKYFTFFFLFLQFEPFGVDLLRS